MKNIKVNKEQCDNLQDSNSWLFCDSCGVRKKRLGIYKCKCGNGKFWVDRYN